MHNMYYWDVYNHTYKIPTTRTDELNSIRAILQWKILTLHGAREFVQMVEDTVFMSLFELRNHIIPPNAILHQTFDIILPFSAPDEGCFIFWCNYKAYLNRSTHTYVLLNDEMVYFDHSDNTGRMTTFKSLGRHNNGIENELNPSLSMLCDGHLFVRKVDRGTIIPILCDCSQPTVYTWEKSSEFWSTLLPLYNLNNTTLCSGTKFNNVCMEKCQHGQERTPRNNFCLPICPDNQLYDSRRGSCQPVGTYMHTSKNIYNGTAGEYYTR